MPRADELGRAFPGTSWLQWNSRFATTCAGSFGAMPTGAASSSACTAAMICSRMTVNAYHAYQSVNLRDLPRWLHVYDLLAYDRKHNAANGHDDTDGPDENWTVGTVAGKATMAFRRTWWNCGSVRRRTSAAS